jgi:hypothetical protein
VIVESVVIALRKLQKGKPVAFIRNFWKQGYYVAGLVRLYAESRMLSEAKSGPNPPSWSADERICSPYLCDRPFILQIASVSGG